MIGVSTFVRAKIMGKEVDAKNKLWAEVAEECEDEVFALCVSLVFSRCIGFTVEGSGELRCEHVVGHHTKTEIACMAMVGILFSFIMIFLIWRDSRAKTRDEYETLQPNGQGETSEREASS